MITFRILDNESEKHNLRLSCQRKLNFESLLYASFACFNLPLLLSVHFPVRNETTNSPCSINSLHQQNLSKILELTN